MSKLHKELDKFRQREDSNSSKEVEEATLLLAAPKEDLAILEKINLDHQIHKNKSKIETVNKLKAFEQMYNAKTYTGDEIKKLCNFYDLKCVRASQYKGKLCPELSTKLKEFTTNNPHVDLRDRNCFIVSTPKSFTKDGENSNDSCIFLYREGDDTNPALKNEVFTELHSWGEPININRKYRFLFNGGMGIYLILLMFTFWIDSYIFNTVTSILGGIIIINNCLIESQYETLWNSIEKE